MYMYTHSQNIHVTTKKQEVRRYLRGLCSWRLDYNPLQSVSKGNEQLHRCWKMGSVKGHWSWGAWANPAEEEGGMMGQGDYNYYSSVCNIQVVLTWMCGTDPIPVVSQPFLSLMPMSGWFWQSAWGCIVLLHAVVREHVLVLFLSAFRPGEVHHTSLVVDMQTDIVLRTSVVSCLQACCSVVSPGFTPEKSYFPQVIWHMRFQNTRRSILGEWTLHLQRLAYTNYLFQLDDFVCFYRVTISWGWKSLLESILVTEEL